MINVINPMNYIILWQLTVKQGLNSIFKTEYDFWYLEGSLIIFWVF